MVLAIIGGSGRLPDILAETEPVARRFHPDGIDFGRGVHAAEAFRFERLGELMDGLRRAEVDRIVFAGAMRRPALDPAAFDSFTADAMTVLGPALMRGDDGLLRSVIGVFEGEGFDVVAAHEVRPDLMPPAGVATAAAPEDADSSDVARGQAILDALGPFDVGQGCVVGGGHVLAIETLGGTDWMLGTLARDVPGRAPQGRSGVFCKAPKRGQDRRIDLPAIGPSTVAAVAAARLRGIAIALGGVIVLDREETVAAADAAGMFLWVHEA